jgi:hypothetical protein
MKIDQKTLETAIKKGLVIGVGALVGGAAEATGKLPKQVSGPALGIVVTSFVLKKFKGVDPTAISIGIGVQALKTVPEMGFFKNLEARASKIGAGKNKTASAGGGSNPYSGATAQADQVAKQAQQAAGAAQQAEGSVDQIEKSFKNIFTPEQVNPDFLTNVPTTVPG